MKKTTQSSVRCLSRLGMLLIAVLFGMGAAKAADSVDLGEIELGKVYDLAMGQVTGTFTAPASGTLKQVGAGDIGLYTDAEHTNSLEGTYGGFETGTAGGQVYTYPVEEGVKYYIYASFHISGNTIVWYMEGDQPLDVVYEQPDSHTQFNFANYKDFTVKFNQAIACGDKAILKWGENGHAEVAAAVFDSNTSVTVPVYATFKDLLANGTVKPNDPFSITLQNLRPEGKDNGENKEFEFLMGSIPSVKVSEKTPAVMKSYFAPGDEDAILKLTFDRELSVGDKTKLEFGWGNLEGEAGEYYVEFLTPTLSEDKKSIIVDFAGVVRTPATMTPLFPDAMYGSCSLKLVGVVDQYGNPVQSGGKGTIGSYSWAIPYELLEKVNIASEFTPANGASLADANEMEVWLKPVDKFQFTGFKFTYADGNETKTVVVAKSQAQASVSADGTEGTYTFAIPAEVKGKKNIVVTLDGFICNDGYDHSLDLMATYDAFVILTCDPANGASMKGLNKNDVITITTNADSEYPDLYLTYDIEDMDAVDEDHRIVKSYSWFTKNANGEFEATIYSPVKMLAAHTYHMNVTAYQSEADTHSVGNVNPPIGTAFITWYGETPAYQYSDVQLVGITPSVETVLTPEDRVFTVEFDGMVRLDKSTTFINTGSGTTADFESVSPVDGDEGYSNVWKLTIGESFMQSVTAQLEISMVATDMEGRRVKGNLGEEENTYFYFTYETEAQYTNDFEIAPVGEAPLKSVKEFLGTSERGITRDYNVADDAAVVYSRLQATVAHVVDAIIDPNTEYGQKNTKITLVLDNEITEPGEYMLSLPKGYFVIDEEFAAQASAARDITFTVQGGDVPPTDFNYTVDPAEGTVTELEGVRIHFTDYEEAGAGSGHASLSIDGGEAIQLPDASFGNDLNEMEQSLPQKYTEPGTYVITFPAGYFNLGSNGEASPEFKLTYVIKGEETLNITVNPAEGEVAELESIDIIFNDYSSAAGGMGHAYLSINGGENIQLPVAEFGAEMNEMIQRLPQKYTEAGTYVITFPEGYFNLSDNGIPSPEFKLTYTISGSGIDMVVADKDGMFRVFNVAGVEVMTTPDKDNLKNLPAGLYIINGKKMMLK